MSEQPITYESMMAMFREQLREQTQAFLQAESVAREEWQKKQDAAHERRKAEFDLEMKRQDAEREKWVKTQDIAFERSKAESDRQNAVLNKKLAELGDRIGQIVAEMVAGNIVGKFNALGYEIDRCARSYEFGNKETGYGEIDLYLEDGVIAILIEVKTKLTVQDIKEHIERLHKFRKDSDRKGDTRRFIAAVAGAVVSNEARDYAYKQGMYVIVPSGDAVEILPVPENFKVKKW